MTDLCLTLSRKEFLKKLEAQVSSARFKHILGVEEVSVRLAEREGYSVVAARTAALLHDYAKEMPREKLYSFRAHPAYDPAWESQPSAFWHGPLAVLLAELAWGLTDPEIKGAVWWHTLGTEKFTPLGKILFVADFIEPSRNFPEVHAAREAARRSLDEAVGYKLKASLKFLLDQEKEIHPQTFKTYNAWFSKERNRNDRKK